jgi:hypothetical protein
MNELLLRRRIAVINSTPSLPYDAEVEYIESNGTQFIELTPVTYSTANSYEIICEVMFTQQNNVVKLNGWDAGGAFGEMNGKSSNGDGTVFGGSVLNTWITSRLLIRQGSSSQSTLYVNINGSNYEKSRAHGSLSTYASNKGYHLFACYSKNKVDYKVSEKIRTCKVYVNDILVCDLIPVRVNQVGYLYDKISGTLFGNNGTGSFGIGNDIT